MQSVLMGDMHILSKIYVYDMLDLIQDLLMHLISKIIYFAGGALSRDVMRADTM